MSGLLVGGVDLVHEIVELHFQLRRTQILLENIVRNSNNQIWLTGNDIANADQLAFEFVKDKFPDLGVQKTPSSNRVVG